MASQAETRIAELGSAYDEMETKVAQEKEALSVPHHPV